MSNLKEMESEMSRNILAFVEYCEALIKIRDERLYRGEHDSFESYLETHFGDQSEMAAESMKFYEEHLSK